MLFLNDLADPAAFPWLVPAPIGYVEDGWSTIVVVLLAEFDVILGDHPRRAATCSTCWSARGA